MTANKCPACGGSGLSLTDFRACPLCSGIEPRAEKTAETKSGGSAVASPIRSDTSCPAEAPTEPGASPEPPEWAMIMSRATFGDWITEALLRRAAYAIASAHARGREEERAAAVHDCVVWLLSNAPLGYKHLAGRLDEAMLDHRKPKEGT